MKITLLHCILFLFISALLISCHEKKVEGNLGEMESYFEEPLTSISSEGDSAFWIGSETGDIWYLKQCSSQVYTIEADRVYKVVTDSVLSAGKIKMCWIGAHNSGLQKWKLTENQSTLTEKYAIPNKGYNYSVYDILLTKNDIYVATSQGLYTKSSKDDKGLRLVYPLENSKTASIGEPFIVNNICLYENRYLLCSTQDGILNLDLLSNKINIYHSGEQIYSLSVHEDEICVLASGHFYIEDIKGNVIHETELHFSPRLYYRLGDVHYFFSESHLFLSDDLNSFLDIPLRRKVPQHCNNVVATDVQNSFTYLVTDHALWNIPFHLSAFNANGEIIASCSDENNIYYLNTNNELYRQSIGESVASKIFEFPSNEIVSGLMSDEDYIYYITNQHILKKIKVNSGYVNNEFFSSSEILYKSPTKITAFCLKPGSYGSGIYLGIQDDLVYIDVDGKSTLIEALHNRYITSFYYFSYSDKLYIATLNDGVYYGSGEHFQVVDGSDECKFIRDISVADGHNPLLMILTNHYLQCKELNDSVALKGYNRLLKVNDSIFYALPEFGLEKYVINHGKIEKRGLYFQDICFNPKASLVLNDTLYLGSSIGVMKQNALAIGSASWIDMDSSVPNFRMIVVGISFVLLILFVIILDFSRRKQSKRKTIKVQIDDLESRLIDLARIARLVSPDEIHEVEELMSLLKHMSKDSSDIKLLSEKIMKKNRDIAFGLSKKLEKQILEMKHYEAFEVQTLVNASCEALSSTHLESIFLRIKENDDWLRQMADLNKRVKDYNEKLIGTLRLKDVNQELCQQIENFKNVIKDTTLSELLGYVAKIDKSFNYLYSDDVLKNIDDWIVKMENELKEQICLQKINKLLQNVIFSLEEIHSKITMYDRIDLLKKLAVINSAIEPIKVKYRVRRLIERYIEEVEKIMNEKTIKKEESNTIIKEETKVIREKTNNIIIEFYEKISVDDKAFLTQILQSRKLESLTAKALVLLIAMPNVKRSYIAGLLGNEDCNISPLISHCFFRLRKEKESLKEFINEHRYSMVNDILQLIEKEYL